MNRNATSVTYGKGSPTQTLTIEALTSTIIGGFTTRCNQRAVQDFHSSTRDFAYIVTRRAFSTYLFNEDLNSDIIAR